MTKREIAMLSIGDHVMYVGKGRDRGKIGAVVVNDTKNKMLCIHDDGDVWSKSAFGLPHIKIASYRHWAFVRH